MTVDRLTKLKVCNDLLTDLGQLDAIMKDYAGFSERYAGDRDASLYRAVASFMTDFYLCTESIFTSIADELDGGAPRGRNWHKRLLTSMAAKKPGVRPAVISAELCAALTPLLAFRHVVPQAYGTTFDEGQLADLERRFLATRELFTREIQAFYRHLCREGAP